MSTTNNDDDFGVSSMMDSLEREKKPHQASFLERLKTFSPLTFFAKPLGVSPIICASMGWCNSGPDMLTCPQCKAKLAILVDETKLGPKLIDKLVEAYQTRLGNAHDKTCVNYRDFPKEQFEDKDSPIPIYMVSMLDSHFVSLVECPKLAHVRKVAMELANTCKLPELEQNDLGESSSLLSKAVQVLANGDNENNNVDNCACLLALLGWTRGEKANVIECKVCLSRLQDDSKDDEVLTHKKKRARKNLIDPIKSHRYYCPYVVGFRGGQGTYKSLARQVLTMANSPTQTGLQADVAMDTIRQLLSKGISTRPKLSTSD